MSYIAQSNVQLIPAVDRIKEEHNQLRGRLHRLVSQLERLSPHDLVALEDACDSVRALLAEYDRHRQKEMHLIQEAFLRDFGGLE
jgi:hemerythrin-like domain-containing protein